MFTGIIQDLGTVEMITEQKGGRKLTILSAKLTKNLQKGSSISVDGICLTVTNKKGDGFDVEAISESLARTTLQSYQKNQKVNLEPALKFGETLDGHLVTGHVDFKTKVISLKKEGNAKILEISFPVDYAKYFAMKGSVAVNGVSLTISKLNPKSFEVNVIPFTQQESNLGLLKKGDEVNIEIDLIARYLENLLISKENQITYQFLQERGFI